MQRQAPSGLPAPQPSAVRGFETGNERPRMWRDSIVPPYDEWVKHWIALGLLLTALDIRLSAAESGQQAGVQPTAAAVRQAAAAGRSEEAWALLERMPAEKATVEVAVELALAPKTASVAANRLALLADRTARLSLSSQQLDRQLTACAVVLRTTTDAACLEQLNTVERGTTGTALDRARLWSTRKLLGEQPAALPIGWEAEVLGSSALEAAAWPELPAASRVRLLEPVVSSRDPGNVIAALATLHMVPGSEALALWRRLSTEGGPSYPGAKTQIMVGLARHGDLESLKALAPYMGQVSVGDRLVLALGRAERREASGVNELVSLLNSGAEHEVLQAAEALASVGRSGSVEMRRVATWIRDGSPALRERWLAVAARLNLGASAEVVRRLTDDDEAVRLAAALAVAAAAVNSRQAGR